VVQGHISPAADAKEMPMFDDNLTREAHALMNSHSLQRAAALAAAVDPVARLWCRSFGVVSDMARERLTTLLSDKALAALAGGVGFDLIVEQLDQAAEAAIRHWFAVVLGRPVEAGATPLAIIRLAYIEVNRDGRWGDAFLDPRAAFAELASDVEAAMIEPTPTIHRRQMTRQVL